MLKDFLIQNIQTIIKKKTFYWNYFKYIVWILHDHVWCIYWGKRLYIWLWCSDKLLFFSWILLSALKALVSSPSSDWNIWLIYVHLIVQIYSTLFKWFQCLHCGFQLVTEMLVILDGINMCGHVVDVSMAYCSFSKRWAIAGSLALMSAILNHKFSHVAFSCATVHFSASAQRTNIHNQRRHRARVLGRNNS